MTDDEDRAHFSAWAMLASPLILGNDVRKMSAATHRTLTSRDAIAINQDPLGISAWRFLHTGDVEYWAKPLANGEWALMILNRGSAAAPVSFDWQQYHVNDDLNKRTADFKKTVFGWTDVWGGRTGDTSRKLETKVPAHGVVLLRLRTKV
jgi:alpha-galactosidase